MYLWLLPMQLRHNWFSHRKFKIGFNKKNRHAQNYSGILGVLHYWDIFLSSGSLPLSQTDSPLLSFSVKLKTKNRLRCPMFLLFWTSSVFSLSSTADEPLQKSAVVRHKSGAAV
jgi:hypothetical protein